MGKKRKKAPKVWCYYCEREFEDEKILIQHQKAKHFKCHVCHKKLSTAGGMVIHVLQVHKEPITKYAAAPPTSFSSELGVCDFLANCGFRIDGGFFCLFTVPNAKPDRESTEIEIFGMEGIPAEILAANEGDQEDDKPAKATKIEVPPSGLGGMVMGSTALGMTPQPMYTAMPRVYVNPTSGSPRPSVWAPQPHSSQTWSAGPMIPGQPPFMTPRPPPVPPQPLFPIQGLHTSPASSPSPSQPPSQPLFPIRPPVMTPASLPALPPQTLFPVNSSSHVLPHAPLPVSSSIPAVPVSTIVHCRPSIDVMTSEIRPASGFGPVQSSVSPASIVAGKPSNSLMFEGSHMYASGPNTGGPSIGPPPVISNKVPTQGVSNEVYLVWDDEAMSMEERRMSLSQYQVHDEASQMHSVDAAIDKRILESRLTSRMTLGV